MPPLYAPLLYVGGVLHLHHNVLDSEEGAWVALTLARLGAMNQELQGREVRHGGRGVRLGAMNQELQGREVRHGGRGVRLGVGAGGLLHLHCFSGDLVIITIRVWVGVLSGYGLVCYTTPS